jgi:hypothetical protein
MNFSPVRNRARSLVALATAACLLALAPRPARALSLLHERPSLADAQLSLLDEPLSLDDRPAPVLTVALADDTKSKDSKSGGSSKSGEAKPGDSSLDFDLLGKPPPTAQVDDKAMHKRRELLKWHQGVGIVLYAAEVATTVVGQLNYNDKFSSNAPNTNKYKQPHQLLAYTTLGLFAVNGTLALLAPEPKGPPKKKWDRVSWHKLGMGLATLGMVAQAGTGIYAASREGFLNQQDYAKAHLAIGYFTFVAMSVAVGALVF